MNNTVICLELIVGCTRDKNNEEVCKVYVTSHWMTFTMGCSCFVMTIVFKYL